MTRSATLAATCVAVVLATQAVLAQDGGHYRDFQLGSNLESVAMLTAVSASQAKTVHTRPAVMQDLQWRRPYASSSGAAAAPDPVQQIAFSFYNDQLFRMVIDYDRERTEGLTEADLVEAISRMYGPVVKPSAKSAHAAAQGDEESVTPIGRWGNTEYTAVLYRSSYAAGFRMIVTSARLSALARIAEAQALRLDEREAPQRERDRQKKEASDARALQEKARLANKVAFTP